MPWPTWLPASLVDARKSGRWGNYRPFVMWFRLPLMLTNFVCSRPTSSPPGMALGGAVAAYGLAIAAFNSAAAKAGEKPSLETVHGIQLWTGGLVAGFSIIAIAIMVFYPLTDAKFKEIVAEIKARREVPAV